MGFRRGPDAPAGALVGCAVRFGPRLILAAGAGEETDFPSLDIYETPGELVIEAELPGVDPARVTITAGAGALVIEGAKEETLAPGRVNFLCMERTFGAFRRVVPLDPAVDLAQASASCRAGVLQIRIPKVEEKRGRRRVIPVIAATPGGEERP